jgi:integrase
MAKPKGPKPKKRKGCPLFPHANGTWAKKIDSRHVHFGPWSDLEAALVRYDDYRKAARYVPAPPPKPDGSIRLEDLVDRYLTRQYERTKAGDLSPRTLKDMREILPQFAEVVGLDVEAGNLRPEDFGKWRAATEYLGQHAANRHIGNVRQMFRWAFEHGLLDSSVRFGDYMRKVSDKARVRTGEVRKRRLFTPAEIGKLIDGARTPLRAMVLLGVNCGFGNTDCGELPLSAVDLDHGVIDFPRPKTLVPRRCILWPETVKAIREAIAARPKPLDPKEPRVFITRYGRPFVRENMDESAGAVGPIVNVDSIGNVFGQLMESAGLWHRLPPAKNGERGKLVRDGRNFYTLRHTFRTWADESTDQHAVYRVMGHTLPGMSGAYVEEISDERLRVITDHRPRESLRRQNFAITCPDLLGLAGRHQRRRRRGNHDGTSAKAPQTSSTSNLTRGNSARPCTVDGGELALIDQGIDGLCALEAEHLGHLFFADDLAHVPPPPRHSPRPPPARAARARAPLSQLISGTSPRPS